MGDTGPLDVAENDGLPLCEQALQKYGLATISFPQSFSFTHEEKEALLRL